MKRVEFEATVCSDNIFHDDHVLNSIKQVCITLLGSFQGMILLKFCSIGRHHGNPEIYFYYPTIVQCIFINTRLLV